MTGWPLAPGDAFQNSWRNDPRFPSLIRITHALHSRSVDAKHPAYTTVPGTDHRALTATLPGVELQWRPPYRPEAAAPSLEVD